MSRAERRPATWFTVPPSLPSLELVQPPTPIDVGDMKRGEKGEGGVTKVTPKKGRQRLRDWQSAFLQHLSAQGNVSRASKAARISRKTVYARRDTDPLFKAAWDDALNEACDHMDEEARRRAVEGTKKPIFYRGQVVGHIREYSDVLLMFLLKAHRPEKYREPTRNENCNIDSRDWTDAQLEAYRAGVPLAQVLAMAGSARNAVAA